MNEKPRLIPATLLFRFSVPCLYADLDWSRPVALDESHRVPTFGELDGRRAWADLRCAWNERGLLFRLAVAGKRRPVPAPGADADRVDGLHLWIDTRDTHNVHRATRFCHRLAFMAPEGATSEPPRAFPLMINRAMDHPHMDSIELFVRGQRRRDGYRLEAHVPAASLAGFDPDEHPRLGFSYAVLDQELGCQTFTVGPELPITDDPSLWGTLELVRRPARS